MIKNFKFCAPDTKDYIFKTYCTSMYGGHLWCQYDVTVITEAKVTYNCKFRKCMNLGRNSSISANLVTS